MVLTKGAHPGAINFDSNRALEKCYGQYEAVVPSEI